MKKLIRYIGYDNISVIEEVISKHKCSNNSLMFINSNIANEVDASIAYKLKEIISADLIIDETKLKNILLESKIKDNKLEFIMMIAKVYKENHKNVSADMLSNFITRIICWTRHYCEIESKSSVLYFGNIKKNEMYFLIFLSYLDYEVTYINTNKDDKFLEIKNIDEYSTYFKGSNYKDISDEEIHRLMDNKKACEEENIPSGRLNLNRNTGRLNLNRDSSDLNRNNDSRSLEVSQNNVKSLNEFLEELKKDTVKEFYNGFIGTELDEKSYIDELCSVSEILDKKFKLIKIENSIMPVSNDEIQLINEKVNNSVDKIEVYKNIFLNEFNDNASYKKILEEFSKTNTQKSRCENFALKLLVWSIRIREFILSKEKNKAVLYFGDIKTHEIYFLKLLKYLNIDVVYIFDSDKYNNELKDIGNINLDIKDRCYNTKEYPKRIIQEAYTSAYEAERRVDSILYNSETGMYRPYSLNEKELKSVILKTTLDEAFILWGEKSKFRSGFINDENKVYIPTLFFKLNGVHEDNDKYLDAVGKLIETSNTLFIRHTNFYRSSYNNQEFYSGSYLLNREGFVDIEKLKSSKFYKYSYLDKTLQNNIIEKINEVIRCSVLLFSKDNDFKVRVLMTILDMEERFIRVLQSYNIGEETPKMVFYNNSKAQYSKEDAILIMFMSLMGVDIAMLNPTGYVNIENLIDENIIPKFKLEKIEYDLRLPDNINELKNKKSILKRIFNFK